MNKLTHRKKTLNEIKSSGSYLSADLVAALAGLQMDNFSHISVLFGDLFKKQNKSDCDCAALFNILF